MKKPNFWLYLAGEAGLAVLIVICVWLGVEHDNAALFFVAGAGSVYYSNLSFLYETAKMEYWRTVRDQEVQP